jgi:hypothetical protein
MRSAFVIAVWLAFAGLIGNSTCVAAQQKTPSTSSAPAATTPTAGNQYAAEGQAKAHCPSDTVVWVNLSSKVYHFSGYKDYGKTKRGAYVCEKDATAQGFRAAKTEKHP